jgi:hypothetical protein
MELWCPFAERRPLGPQTEPTIGTPRVLIAHTMVGFLRGTEAMFRRSGYGGTEATFGIGGLWDSGLDGAIWQWQALDHQADAQFDGNAYATSIETSDGGDPTRPWSDAQQESLTKLGVWWCEQTGHPARLVAGTGQAGLGYHAQFAAWNKSAHACPGTVRLHQWVNDVIPEIARRLGHPDPVKPEVPPEFKRDLRNVRPMTHGSDVRVWQARAAGRGYRLAVDSWYGDESAAVCMAFQSDVGMSATGVVDAETWHLTWAWEPRVTVDPQVMMR